MRGSALFYEKGVMDGQTDGHMDRQRCDASAKRARIAARILNFSMMETFLAAYHAFTKTHVVFVERAMLLQVSSF